MGDSSRQDHETLTAPLAVEGAARRRDRRGSCHNGPGPTGSHRCTPTNSPPTQATNRPAGAATKADATTGRRTRETHLLTDPGEPGAS